MTAKGKIDKAARKVVAADAAITDRLSADGDAWPMKLLALVGGAGDQPQLRALSTAVLAAGLAGRNRRLVRAGVRMLLAHELATAAKSFVKHRVDRTRPRSADTRRQARPRAGRNRGKEVSSFPSGHTAGSLAVARAFAREFPEYGTPALTAAGLVALAQIPRSAHYPSDIAAGALIGGVAESLVATVWPAEEGDEGSRL